MALLILPPSLHIDVVIFENQKLHMQTGYSILSPPRLANPNPKPLVVFGFSHLFFRRVKSVNSHKDGAGRGRHPRDVIVFGFSYLFGVSKVSTVTGMGRVGVAILETVIVFGFSYLFGVSKKVNSHRDGAGRDRHPRDCDRFWLLISFWRVKSVNSHRDGAGRGRHPRNCDRCWFLIFFWRVQSVNSHRDGAGRGRHPRICDRFWLLISIWRVQKSQQSQGWGGSGSPSSRL